MRCPKCRRRMLLVAYTHLSLRSDGAAGGSQHRIELLADQYDFLGSAAVAYPTEFLHDLHADAWIDPRLRDIRHRPRPSNRGPRNAAIYDKAGQAARHGTSSALVARRWCRSFGFATKDPSGALWRTAGRGRRSEIPCVQNFRASDASAAGRRAVDAASAEDTGSSGGHVDSAGTTHREDCAASAAAHGHNQCAAIPGHAQS